MKRHFGYHDFDNFDECSALFCYEWTTNYAQIRIASRYMNIPNLTMAVFTLDR
jgi:hypothetical protein